MLEYYHISEYARQKLVCINFQLALFFLLHFIILYEFNYLVLNLYSDIKLILGNLSVYSINISILLLLEHLDHLPMIISNILNFVNLMIAYSEFLHLIRRNVNCNNIQHKLIIKLPWIFLEFHWINMYFL